MNRYLRAVVLGSGMALAAAAATVSAGCNILGPALYFAHGPEKTPRVHELSKDRPTVIFIDDRSNKIPRRVLRVTIGEEAERLMLDKKVIATGKLISSQSSLAAASQDKFGEPLPVTEIGRAVNAEVVVYAAVDEFTLSPDGQSFIPTVSMRVKVIDAVSEERIWPAEGSGHPVRIRLPIRQGTAPTSIADQMRAEQELARYAGQALAKLFYTHEADRGVNAPE